MNITHAEGIGTSLLWNIITKPNKALRLPQIVIRARLEEELVQERKLFEVEARS